MSVADAQGIGAATGIGGVETPGGCAAFADNSFSAFCGVESDGVVHGGSSITGNYIDTPFHEY
jgi:hypothetical protein